MPRDLVLPVRKKWPITIPALVQDVLQDAARVLLRGEESFALRTSMLRRAAGERFVQLTPYHDGRVFLRVVFPQTGGWYEFGVAGREVKGVQEAEKPLAALFRHLQGIGYSVRYGDPALPKPVFSPPKQKKRTTRKKAPAVRLRAYPASESRSGLPLAALGARSLE